MQNLEKKLSLGFAFVQMPDRECAKKAILELNGKEMNGRTLKVSIANDKEAKRARKLQKLKGKDPRQKKC
jgi:RNA recognition motif-containing protein